MDVFELKLRDTFPVLAFTVANNAADTMDILANADSSLAETTLRIVYSVRLFGSASTAVTAQ